MMVDTASSLRYSNVISKVYSFHYTQMEEILEEFRKTIIECGLHPKGPLFYSLLNIPVDEEVVMEVFLPLAEEFAHAPEGMRFHSYYSVETMLMTVITEHFETETGRAYAVLLSFMEQFSLRQLTPFYHIIMGDREFPYMLIKAGYEPLPGGTAKQRVAEREKGEGVR